MTLSPFSPNGCTAAVKKCVLGVSGESLGSACRRSPLYGLVLMAALPQLKKCVLGVSGECLQTAVFLLFGPNGCTAAAIFVPRFWVFLARHNRKCLTDFGGGFGDDFS